MGRSSFFREKQPFLEGFTFGRLIEAIDDKDILKFVYGLTTAVVRLTAHADKLSKEEFTRSFKIFEEKMSQYQPKYIAFLGKPAYAVFSGKKQITWGKQNEKIQNATVWVLPNPRGLNRGFTIENLINHYAELYHETIRHDTV